MRVYTDEGIVGTGECNSGGPGFSGFATKAAILALRELLIGEDPFNINMLYEKLRRAGRYGGASQAPLIFALTGIDNALHDIVGKALGVPVYKLLGGKFRGDIRLYADCHFGEDDSPASFGDKALEAVAEGFRRGQVRRRPHWPRQAGHLELDGRRARDDAYRRAGRRRARRDRL